MSWPFDIFKVEPHGQVLWLEAVGSLPEARARVQELAKEIGAQFIVLNQLTGTRYHFPSAPATASGTDSAATRFSLPLSA
jgi:hypothetical protein